MSWLMEIIPNPSPNYNERPAGQAIDMIVLHYTDMLSAIEALDLMCDPNSKVSAHYLIDKAGVVYQLVDDSKRAWHAGVSEWQGEENINNCSLGIELDNKGHTYGHEPFPDIQMQSLLKLLEHCTARYHIPKNRILGHSDIAPERKQDPGPFFDWDFLLKHGYGVLR